MQSVFTGGVFYRPHKNTLVLEIKGVREMAGKNLPHKKFHTSFEPGGGFYRPTHFGGDFYRPTCIGRAGETIHFFGENYIVERTIKIRLVFCAGYTLLVRCQIYCVFYA